MVGSSLDDHCSSLQRGLQPVVEMQFDFSVNDNPKVLALRSVHDVVVVRHRALRWKVNGSADHAGRVGDSNGFAIPLLVRRIEGWGYTVRFVHGGGAVEPSTLWLTVPRVEGGEISIIDDDGISIGVVTFVRISYPVYNVTDTSFMGLADLSRPVLW